MPTQDDLFARDDIKRIVEKAKQTTRPILGHNLKLIRDTAQQIEGEEGYNIRKPSNIKQIQKGKPTRVERMMGYSGQFDVKGVESPGRVTTITIGDKVVKIPRLENYKTYEAYNNALKKFRINTLEPLLKQSKSAAQVLTSGAYLDQFAENQRQEVINNPKLHNRYGVTWVDKLGRYKIPQWGVNMLNKERGYIFGTVDPKGGLPKGAKVQSKMYQMINNFWKKYSANLPKNIKPLKNINFKLAISEIDQLLNSAKTVLQKKKAIATLTAFLASISKGTFGAGLATTAKVTGVANVVLMGQAYSDVMFGTDFFKAPEEKPVPIEEEPAPIERFNRGGIMDINYMTRPLGYAIGGDVLDKIRELENQQERLYKLNPGQTLYDKDGNQVGPIRGQKTELERAHRRLFEIEQRLSQGDLTENESAELERERQRLISIVDPVGQISDYEQGLLKLSPGEKMYDADGNVVTENPLPYDPDKGYTENLNELMTDIGGTLKEKVKGAGSSLIDKINDFIKYGWGDKENYMEIGGEQVDPDDPNFRRFIEDNYMGEGEDYIDGIENYRRFMEGEGFRRGGIVSLNHMTRAL